MLFHNITNFTVFFFFKYQMNIKIYKMNVHISISYMLCEHKKLSKQIYIIDPKLLNGSVQLLNLHINNFLNNWTFMCIIKYSL